MDLNISKYYFSTGSFFEGLSKEHFRQLKSKMQRVEKKKGELIFKKGTLSKGVYILRKGKIKIYQVNQDGKSQILYIYKKGDFFGYKPLLCNETHPVTAAVLEDAVISFIPKHPFLEVLNVSSQLSNKLLFNLSHEFTVWVNATTAFAQQTVKERFALILLILNEKYKTEGDKNPVELNLSREDLASMVGTATESVIRTLSDFKEEKLIEIRDKQVVILNPDKLARMKN